MSLASGTKLGPYEILSALGAGGMGEVYRARDPKLNRDVAIKVLLPAVANDPDRLARFSREAQVLASLNHPNIAAIYGLEEVPSVSLFDEKGNRGSDIWIIDVLRAFRTKFTAPGPFRSLSQGGQWRGTGRAPARRSVRQDPDQLVCRSPVHSVQRHQRAGQRRYLGAAHARGANAVPVCEDAVRRRLWPVLPGIVLAARATETPLTLVTNWPALLKKD